MPLHEAFLREMDDGFWTSYLSSWAVILSGRLNRCWVPKEFLARNRIKIGYEIESPLKSYDPPSVGSAPQRPGEEPAACPTWSVPPPRWSVPRTKGDHVEVVVGDRTQVWSGRAAVVAFVTPTNKETLQQRRAFLCRCATHLYQGASLVVLDVITAHSACLFNDLLTLLGVEDVPRLPKGTHLFAAAFRPVSRGDRTKVFDDDERLELDVWLEPVAVGEPLPTLPLRLIYDLYVPVEFELTYQEVCRSHRLE